MNSGVSRKRISAWTRDELILALDLYFRISRKDIRAGNAKVRELSEVLNRLHPTESEEERRCRNANGVKMKLHNFSRFDRGVPGAGLSHGSRLEEAIWKEFENRRTELSEQAVRIKLRVGKSTTASRATPSTKSPFISFGRGVPPEVRRDIIDRGEITCGMCGVEPGEAVRETRRNVRLHVSFEDQSRNADGLSRLRILCSTCKQGMKAVTAKKPTAIWLLSQIKRAGLDEQRAVFARLQEKFGN